MAMNEFEVTLVTAARSGNSKAFEELYSTYYNKIFALARMTVKNEADAEDVLQQTFINAWRNLRKLSDSAAFNTWIQKIALNLCYSVLRKKNIAILLDTEGEIENIGEDEPDGDFLPSVYAERDDLRARMGKIIDGLSEVQKQTVLLYYFNELKVEEISYVMECTVGTVKTRLFLARKAIRSEIEEQERKSGEKFYGIAGIPMLTFGNLLTQVFEAQTIAPTVSANILSGISNAITQGAIEAAQAASSIAGTSATAGASGTSGDTAGVTGTSGGTAGVTGASGGASGISTAAKIIIAAIATSALVGVGALVWNAVSEPTGSPPTPNSNTQPETPIINEPSENDTDYVIQWVDPHFESLIRKAINEPIGDILNSDLNDITAISILGYDHIWLSEIGGDGNWLGGTQAGLFLPQKGGGQSPYFTDFTNDEIISYEYGIISSLEDMRHFSNLTSLLMYYNEIVDLSPLAGMTSITNLQLLGNNIKEIAPLAGLNNLEILNLQDNSISDVSPLAGLIGLKRLNLIRNRISDISLLFGLTNLDNLRISGNDISNISGVDMLTNLTVFHAGDNQIRDISDLRGLTQLESLFLNDNPITDWSPVSHIENVYGRP